MKKYDLWIMCGPPGSGKTTQAKSLAELQHAEYISRDEIRFSLVKPDEEYFSKEKQVYRTFINSIKDAMIKGKNIIVDATHLTIDSRCNLLQEINPSSEYLVVAIDMQTPLEVCLNRNTKRCGRERVPSNVVNSMHSRHEAPSLEEGFDIILTYTTDDKGKFCDYAVTGKEGL